MQRTKCPHCGKRVYCSATITEATGKTAFYEYKSAKETAVDLALLSRLVGVPCHELKDHKCK